MLTYQGHRVVGQGDGALAAVLRRPHLDSSAAGALHLPTDIERALQERDVADLDSADFPDPQPGDRPECDARREGRLATSSSAWT
ncbi:hypothetical protein [Pseudonocardia tropica]|uniref:hypothetical protein n=1 Tax=Pseudonocardia tropica TaxID=681289 RepID=UPI0031ED6DCD